MSKTNKAIKEINKIYNKTLKNIMNQKGLKKVSQAQKMELAYSLTRDIIYKSQ